VGKKDFNKELVTSGLKKTKHRTEILEILDRSRQPIPAEQVYLDLKDQGVTVNLSTVYRTLETLADRGLVTKVKVLGDNRALFELNRMVHKHYLVCLECKKMKAIECCPIEEYEKSLAQQTDFLISGHRLDIYGYCPKCREKHTGGQ
jgi:Fur family ferric uptake transcriptional regulator